MISWGVRPLLHRTWPAGLLLLLLLAMFAPWLADGRVLAVGDGLAQDFPLRLLAAQIWLGGHVPFWNPYGFGGQPMLAAMHVGVFFPGNLAFLVLSPVAAMNATEILALWTAGLSAYLLARAHELSRSAAFTSGLVFMGSGFMVAHIENLQMLQAAALMPAVLWAIARHAAAPHGCWAIAFAALLALQVLAGHPQMVVFTGLVAVPYTLFLMARRPAGTRLAFGLPLGAAAFLGLGLAGMQLLPALDFIPRTQRHAIDYDSLTFRSLPQRQLLTLWFPYMFGGYGTPAIPLLYWGGPHQTDLTGYAGLVSLVLGGGALLALRKRPAAAFWLLVVVGGAMLAEGSTLLLYRYWSQLPIVKSLPAPGRHLLLVDLGIAMLAGLGLEALRDVGGARRAVSGWVLAGLPLLAAVVALAIAGPALEHNLQIYMPSWISLHGAFAFNQPSMGLPVLLWLLAGLLIALGARLGKPEATRMALVGLLAADLGFFALEQGWAVRSPKLPAPAVLPAPDLAAGEARAWPHSSHYAYPYDDFANVRLLHYPNWGGLAGVRTLNGYDAFIPARYATIMGQMASTGLMPDDAPVFEPGHHGLAIMGVHTLLYDAGLATDASLSPRITAKRYAKLPDAPVATFVTRAALPRAWRLMTTATAAPAEVDRHVMQDPAFDPARAGYLDAGADAGAGTWSPGPAAAAAPDPNHLDVETDGPGPGFVAVSEGYDPGWRAYVEGREVTVYCLDGLVLGVPVPAGPQRVILAYEPRAWRGGLALSAAALALLLLWLSRVRTA